MLDDLRSHLDSLDEADSGFPQGTLTVAGVATYIKESLELDPNLRQIWVLGEVSSVSQSAKGIHFTLQDPVGKQSLLCVAWNSYAHRLKTLPSAGEQVIALGEVKTYIQQSRYQLQVYQILPAGAGLQALRFRQLYDRLAAEGLFDPDRKRPLPSHPQTIAVVTSPNAAAWGDIQKTLRHRYPGLQVLLSPAIVQGETAPASIAAAIDRVETDGRAEVVILARGGGAAEDLACFNDEWVVRAVALCKIPVISGIGHERDESLADLAADYFAHTPTAAAEVAVPCLADLAIAHLDRVQALRDAMEAAIADQQIRLMRLRDRLTRVRPDRQLHQEQQRLHWLKKQLMQSIQQQLQQAQQHQKLLKEKLITLDPNAVLKRGYAVVRSEGQIVRSSQQVQVGQSIAIKLAQGSMVAQITEIPSDAVTEHSTE
ncbi:exodeoxyribonuclease VII large subunit [Alkalinema sp. FACHB-956]|uniref:exodeoxyribonuclease VII large subunit n=1 Tax=Alkalinema sp. FACHB-956 TaxID=2692768 RepID=UPI001683EE45|nr:exodeoxyribonuclease VII large subunit [Alkalinema sp. FACHB-956]MBD2329473.1 exodeoxyribonuclease VII large subunit [Alkalinema sp. FACHB-956]